MQYNNRNFNNNPPPTNRGPAIRAGLSVQVSEFIIFILYLCDLF